MIEEINSHKHSMFIVNLNRMCPMYVTLSVNFLITRFMIIQVVECNSALLLNIENVEYTEASVHGEHVERDMIFGLVIQCRCLCH